jgi:hypothetical protein
MAAPQRPRHTAADPRQTEVIAEYRDTGFPKAANDGLHFLDLLGTLWTIEQNIVPVRRIEIFDRGEVSAAPGGNVLLRGRN